MTLKRFIFENQYFRFELLLLFCKVWSFYINVISDNSFLTVVFPYFIRIRLFLSFFRFFYTRSIKWFVYTLFWIHKLFCVSLLGTTTPCIYPSYVILCKNMGKLTVFNIWDCYSSQPCQHLSVMDNMWWKTSYLTTSLNLLLDRNGVVL